MSNIKFKKMQGVGMIEIMVTILVTSVGLLGMAALQTQAVKSTTDAGQRTVALTMVYDFMARLHSNRTQAVSYKAAVDAANCGATPTICSTGTYNGSIKAGVNCTPQQGAAFDVWDVMCDHNNKVGTLGKSSSFDYVSNPVLTMTCTNPDVCSANSTVTLRLDWDERKDKRKNAATQSYVTVSSPI